MKFLHYLNEEEKQINIVEIIKNECQPWLRTIKPIINTGKTFIRYVKPSEPIKKITPRTDRYPKNSSQELHDIFDNGLKKIFGWKPRSEGVFVYPIHKLSNISGPRAYLFYPIGEFKYIWSPKIRDLYNIQTDAINNPEKFIKMYIDKNLLKSFKGQLNHSNEIMFKCDSYYLVTIKYRVLLGENELL
jgi:hypothetical protein